MKLRRSTLRPLVGLSLLFLLLSTLAPQATGQVNVKGQWTTQSGTMPLNPIHAALMSNGKSPDCGRFGKLSSVPSGMSDGSTVWSGEWLRRSCL